MNYELGKWGSGEVGKWGSGEVSGKIFKLRILRARLPLISHFCRRYIVILSLSFPKMSVL
ncbi:MAG: hypothetical protein GPI95_15215 [Microcystis aeruginosa LG13-11]|jgi:hypothetical protein|nr:hypothetical protein [Microcystis aeruginosa LG13-11]